MSKLLIVGNQFDGCKYYGPFADNAVAMAYGEKERDECHWWVGDLERGAQSAGVDLERMRNALTTLAYDVFPNQRDMQRYAEEALQMPAPRDIVIVGNPIDGFKYFGPFADEDAARTFADEVHGHDTWWIASLEDMTA